MSFDLDTLYNLLPAIYQIRDLAQRTGVLDASEQGNGVGTDLPLRALLSVFAEQIGILEENLAQLYDDQFIETCAEWAIPYIGDLVGYHIPHRTQTHTMRAEVANTIAYRKRKGTAQLIAQLARDITGWDAVIVEYFQRIAATQHINNPRPGKQLVSLRDTTALLLQQTPFESLTHTIDLRNRGANSQPYNIPDLGVFLWRLKAYPLNDVSLVQAFAHDQQRYLFSPLGNAMPLFSVANHAEHAREQDTVAQPLTRELLKNYLADYYGRAKSLELTFLQNGERTTIPPDAVHIMDLSDRRDADGNHLRDEHGHPLWSGQSAEGIAIDPLSGRIAFADAAGAYKPAEVHASFYYGFSDDLGGGLYPRAATFTSELGNPIRVEPKTLQGVLHALQTDGIVELPDSQVYSLNLSIKTTTNQRLELRAADLQRPILHLSSREEEPAFHITAEEGSQVILNGLTIYHGPIRVHGNLERLIIRHCTLVPGLLLTGSGEPEHPGRPVLIVDAPHVLIEIDRSIVGTLHIHDNSTVHITNSIVDATRQNAVAFAPPSGHPPHPGGALTVTNSTIIGRVYTVALNALNTLFVAESSEEDIPPVSVMRRQEGSVRYSFTPPHARLPRVYHHRQQEQPGVDQHYAGQEMKPIFTSLRYGHPGYCQLQQLTHPAIRQGADNRAEMGVFNSLLQPQHEANLRTRLAEYLRFDVKPTIIYIT